MNNEPREILKQLVSERGESVYRDPKLCNALLKDLGGRYEKENFLLVSALERGIVSEIRKCSTSAAPAEIRLAQLSTRLQELGFKVEEANWAIESWARALGIGAKLPETLPTSVPNPDSGQATRLQKENEDLSRTVQLLSDELGRISVQSSPGEVNRLQQEVRDLQQKERQLQGELAKRSNSTSPTTSKKPIWIAIGILAGLLGLGALGQLTSQFRKINELTGQVASLESEKTNLSEKSLAQSKQLIALENSRKNSNRAIKNSLRFTSNASLQVCNKSSKGKSIFVAIGWEENDNKWHSQGWWEIKPNECKQPINYTLYKPVDEVYIYGFYSNSEVSEDNYFSSEDKSICVNSVDAFKLSESDRSDRCNGENQKIVSMSQFIIYSGENTWNFTDPNDG